MPGILSRDPKSIFGTPILTPQTQTIQCMTAETVEELTGAYWLLNRVLQSHPWHWVWGNPPASIWGVYEGEHFRAAEDRAPLRRMLTRSIRATEIAWAKPNTPAFYYGRWKAAPVVAGDLPECVYPQVELRARSTSDGVFADYYGPEVSTHWSQPNGRLFCWRACHWSLCIGPTSMEDPDTVAERYAALHLELRLWQEEVREWADAMRALVTTSGAPRTAEISGKHLASMLNSTWS